MAYQVVREHTYPAWTAFSGEYDILTGSFQGPPEQLMPVNWASWIIQQYEQLFPAHGETMMYIRVEADWSPTLWTNYRIITYSHDLIQEALLIALAAALLTAAIYCASWAFDKSIKAIGQAVPPIGLGILLGGAGVFLVLTAMTQSKKLKAKG